MGVIKSADKADKLTAKIRGNLHHRLTLPKVLLNCKVTLMNNFQSDTNGAEVAGASDSNPVRVARPASGPGMRSRRVRAERSETDRPSGRPAG